MSVCECKSAAESCGCGDKLPVPGLGLYLAIAAVPMQEWEKLYEPAEGLKQGTIFPKLNLPFYITGGESRG